MWLFCFVLAYAFMKAWEEGRAQAGAEWRRAREHAAGEFARRMAAGEVASPWDDPWWWAAAARRAWRSLTGPRAGATRTALPHSTPLRRIAAAAMHGAARGFAGGAQRGRERRAERAARGPGLGQRAAGAAGYGAGYAAGRAGWRWRRRTRRVALAMCDDCGQVCAVSAMAYQRREVDGRTETWLLCASCRSAPAPDQEPGAGPALAAVAASVTTTVTTTTTTTVSAAVLAGITATGAPAAAVEPAAADSAGIIDGELVDDVDDDVPASGAQGSAALPDGEPGSVPAAAIPAPAGDPDRPAVTGHQPGTAPSLTGTSTDGGTLTTELVPAGRRLPAQAGEAYNYGAWQRATATDGEVLDQLGLHLEAMLSDLTVVSAGRTQVQNVTAWADRVRSEASLTRDAVDEMDRRYQPVIAAVAAIGGPDEASNSSYYREL